MIGNSAIPDLYDVRRRIETIKHRDQRYAIMFLYLIDGRVSEGVSKRCPKDIKTTPRGPTGKDVDYLTHKGEEAAIFHVLISKRDGAPRVCAHPRRSAR